MVDFDKLNDMINEVNNIIEDVKTQTVQMNKDTAKIKKDKFIEVNKILINYYDVYMKSIGDAYSGRDFKINIPLGAGRIKFSNCGICVHLNCDDDKRNPSYNDYSIWCTNDDKRIEFSYQNYNKSHPSIIWFTNLAMVWNEFENEFDKIFIEQIHNILKQRSENTHKTYNNAQRNLEHYRNLI